VSSTTCTEDVEGAVPVQSSQQSGSAVAACNVNEAALYGSEAEPGQLILTPECLPASTSTATPRQSHAPSSIIRQTPDIGYAVGNNNLTDQERVDILETRWKAPEHFQWPYSERKDCGKMRRKYLGPQHFADRYSVFTYSLSQQGVLCKPCVLFAPDSVRGVKLHRLVKSPLQDYSHLTGKNGYLTSHLSTDFHEDSVSKASAFLNTFHKQSDVAQQLNAAAAAETNKNRRALAV